MLALIAAALGWGALGAANYITYRSFTGSLGGSVFFFARLSADRDAAAALRPKCEAGRLWVACGFLDRFGLSADEFLWRPWSPLPEMGYGPGFMREAAEINPVLFQKTWPDWLSASGRRALQQIGRFELGDGMDEEGVGMLAYKFSEQEQPPQELSRIAVAAGDSRQATDGLRPLMPRAPAETLAITGLAALAGLLFFGSLWRRPDLWWPALLFLAAYAGNAALIGLGGEVHDRYGARLVWLAPLLAALLALRGARPAGAEDGSDQRRPR